MNKKKRIDLNQVENQVSPNQAGLSSSSGAFSNQPNQNNYQPSYSNQPSFNREQYSPNNPYQSQNVTSSFYAPKHDDKAKAKPKINKVYKDPVQSRKKRIKGLKIAYRIMLIMAIGFLSGYLIYVFLHI